MKASYRSRNRLVMDLLAAIAKEGPVGVRRLLMVANLTHATLQDLLASFEAQGWVVAEREGDARQWRVAAKGAEALAFFRRVDAVMQDHGLGL